MKRIGAVVQGRVQGVGFRFFTRALAFRYRLTGWVRNLPDGNVELEAQGLPPSVDSFIAEIGQGPPLSHIDEVQLRELPKKENEQGFEIRY